MRKLVPSPLRNAVGEKLLRDYVLYWQAQAILAADVPWVPLAHSKVVFAVRSSITGLVVQPSAIGLYRWAERAR